MSYSHGIMFHHFHSDKHYPTQGSLSQAQFARMLDWLQSRYNLLDADEYADKSISGALQPDDVCLSFDDALLCQYDVALPVLQDYDVRAFFFVYSSVFGDAPDLLEVYRLFRTRYFDDIDSFYAEFFTCLESRDEAGYLAALKNYQGLNYLAEFPFYSENDKLFRYLRDRYLGPENYHEIMAVMMSSKQFDVSDASRLLWMTESNLQDIARQGHSIGLHSYSHPTRMSELSFQQQQQQYLQNLNHLEGVLGHGNIQTMSHPCGDYNEDTLKILREMGISIGFRSSLGEQPATSHLEIPREDHANIIRKMNQ